MKIKINDITLCDSCTFKTCSINDVIEKVGFYHLKTEKYVCPAKIMLSGPNDKQTESQYMDIEGCLGCDLCIKKCCLDNLTHEHNCETDFSYLNSLDVQMASITTNCLALSYMNELFDFAANTNINKALSFDGYVAEANGNQYFVEVSYENDSLESCRRLLGDIATHNFSSSNKIYNGIIVLKDMPDQGSRDIFPLVSRIASFPGTNNLNIFLITLELLKKYFSLIGKNQRTVSELMYNITSESIDMFYERINTILNV